MQATETLCHLSVTDIKKIFCNAWFFCKNEACVNCGKENATTLTWLLRGKKGLFNFSPGCIVDGDFCLPNEIDSWNFQHMLLFWFREASQNLSLFRQLFFHSFQEGTKGKMLKKWQNYTLVSFGSHLKTMKKKSCLNKLEFWEASQN